jgi:rubrerythrin
MQKEKLISAEALLLSVRDDPEINAKHFARFKEHINHAPDAVKHGRWLNAQVEAGDPFGYGTYEIDVFICSVCGVHFDVSECRNYCPNCGARMDGAEDGK